MRPSSFGRPRRWPGTKALSAGTILLALTTVAPHDAWAADVRWSNSLGLEAKYDDNITQLSQKDLDRLSQSGGGSGFGCGSSSTATSGGRFSITTPDDFII